MDRRTRRPLIMTWALDCLPAREGGAAENMAADFLLLKQYPSAQNLRFRHYGWHRPSFTFGFSQTLAYVQTQLPAEERVELCRRPTGGGIVDHRNDWTYALVIPRHHPWSDLRAVESYRLVHQAISDALQACGEQVHLLPDCLPAEEGVACAKGPTVCFSKPEKFDVVRLDTGLKVAGAAQKRTKDGLLFQGSLARASLRSDFPWDPWAEDFCRRLAEAAEATQQSVGWPDWPEGAWEGLTDTYSAPEWNAYR